MGRLRALIAFFSMTFLFAVPASAEKRVALVIGNSAYRNAPELINPKNDATDIAARLGQLGFAVTQGQDLDLAGMRNTVREFVQQLADADIAMLFYAGHGLQVNGINYMVPIDAKLSSHDDLEFEAMTMDLVLASMERNAKVNLVILDACRDNPLARNLARSMGTRSSAVGSGLARIGSGVGTLIAFATQPGNVALDGTGRNSPFTSGLLKHLGTPGQDITRDLIHVRREVLDATQGKQVPWDNSSLTGEVILKPLAPGASGQSGSAEVAFWESIKASEDKTLFEKYLERFPGGVFTDLAQIRLAAIEKREEAERKAKEEEQKKLELAKLEEAKAQERAAAVAKQPLLPGLPGSADDADAIANPELARRITVASLGADADPRLVQALPVLGQYNIRYGAFRKNLYIAVLTWGKNWIEAHQLAGRAGGHLVTITDKEENAFVYKLFSSDDRFMDVGADGMDINGPWIGLYQPKGSKEPKGGWRWVTEEPLKYTNWLKHQPNNFNGDSNVGIFYSYGAREPGEEQRPIYWDDAQGQHGKRGFIVEFEASDRG